MRRQHGEAARHEILARILCTLIGWGIEPEQAVGSLANLLGGLVLGIIPLSAGIAGLIELSPSDPHRSNPLLLVLFGLPWTLLFFIPLAGFLRAWAIGRFQQQRVVRIEGRILFLRQVATLFDRGQRMLVKIHPHHGPDKWLVVGSHLTRHLCLGRAVVIHHLSRTEVVVRVEGVSQSPEQAQRRPS